MFRKNKQEVLPFSDELLLETLNSLNWSDKTVKGNREIEYANRIELSNVSVVLGLVLTRGVRFTIGNIRFEVETGGKISRYDTTKLVKPNSKNKFFGVRKL